MSSSIDSSSNFQFILDALADYAKQTGMDLTKNPFVDHLQSCHSPHGILQLLHDKANAFKDYRDGNRELLNWLSPLVHILHAFSGILDQAVSPDESIHLFGLGIYTSVPRYHFLLRRRSLPASMFSSRYISPFTFFGYILITPGSTIRQLAMLAQVMMRSLTFSNVSQIFSNVYKFIPRSH